MAPWRASYYERLRLVLALSLILPACSQNGDFQSKKSDDPKTEPDQAEKRAAIRGESAPSPKDIDKTLKLNIGKCTLMGPNREFNDDAIAVSELSDSTLCLVADGMGGKVGARVLGQIACKRVFEVLMQELNTGLPPTSAPDDNRIAIRRAIVAADKDIIAMAGKDHDLENMGATIVVALWRGRNHIYVAGVGDCRAYLVRREKIEQLTVDDSLAQALVEARTITPEEARTHRLRNVLWKYLGSKEVGDGPTVKVVPVQPRDRLLLCTRGVHGTGAVGSVTISDQQLLSCMRRHAEAQSCATAVCQFALDAGSRGSDISCLVIDISQAF
jgi:protein phosphatase